MKLIDTLPTGTVSRGLRFLQAYAADADDLQITLRTGQQRMAHLVGYIGVYGYCYYPALPGKKGPTHYRMMLNVPGPFPISIQVRRPPAYIKGGTYPTALPGCHLGKLKSADRNGEKIHWLQQWAWTMLRNADEGLVWLFGHEWYHYGTHSKRLPGRNNEIEADLFADALLIEYQQSRGR